MKQKLPEKKSSYKNLYLCEIQKTRILSNSWVKCSLLGLLIAKFFNKKNLINSFNSQMITLSIDLRSLEKKNNFILNSLMLFTLPMFILIYRSNTINIVEKNSFNLTKIQQKDYNEKNYMGIYKKSFKNFNTNLDIFLPNVFERKKLLKPDFNFNNDLFEKSKDKFIDDLNFYLFVKEIKNDDCYCIRKIILQNLKNLGESNEILVKSSFFFKEKGHLYFRNYMKVYLRQLKKKNYNYYQKFEPKTFKEKNIKYFSNELNNPKLYLNFENVLSNAVYKFSKHLKYKVKEYNIQIENENLFNKNINIFDYPSTINKNVKNYKFFTFNNLNQFYNFHTNNHNLKWITKILYSRDISIQKPIFFNKYLSLFKKRPNSFFDFFKKISKSQYILNINNFFPQPKTKKRNPIFFGSLLIDEFTQEFDLINKKNNKILKNFETIRHLKNNIEFDDIEIISWETQKYHSDFLLNASFPFNLAYNIISQNHSLSKKIGYMAKEKSNGFLLRTLNLFPSFLNSKVKKNSVKICLDLKKHLIIRTKQLDIMMDQSNEIKDPNKILLMSQDSNKNKLIKNCLFLKNLIYDNSYKYCSKLFFEFFHSKMIYKKNIFDKYSILWKKNFQKNFIYNLNSKKYKRLGIDVYYWLYEMKKSSKKIVPYDFLISLNLNKKLKKSFQNSNIDVEPNNKKKFLIKNSHLVDENINKFIGNWISNEKDNKIIYSLLTTYSGENTILLDEIKREKLFVNFNNYSQIFELNYKKKFLFYSQRNAIKNHSIIYLQFLKNFLKYNKFNQNLIKKEIYRLFQLKLTNNFDKTNLISFSYLQKNISKQIKLFISTNSKIDLSKQEKNIISKKKFKEKEIKIHKIYKNILPNLNNIKIKNYYNTLQYQSLTKKITKNSLLFQSMNKIFMSPTLKNFEPKVEKKIFVQIEKIYNKLDLIDIFSFFEGYLSVKDLNYKFWFFTLEWWEYNLQLFVENLEKYFIIIGSYLMYLKNNISVLTQNNYINFYEKKKLYILNAKWNLRFLLDYKEKIIFNFVWSDYKLINNLNNLHWAVFSLITFVLLFYENYFSIFIGSDSINLWIHFENIEYLTDTSRASYFTKLLYRNKMQFNKTENLLIFFVTNLKHYTRNIFFYLVTKKKINKWLGNNKSLDLSRRKRNLLVQSLITPSRIKKYGFQFYSQPKILNDQLFGYHINSEQGLSYIRYVSQILKKNLVNYSQHLAEKWIFFASLQKIISSQTLQQTKNYNPRFNKIPLRLQLGLSCSKGILLIGPVESGRSYLIKNLAADSSVPLLGISINKLMYNKPDFITESWMNILIESLRRLNLILDLAKGMSPCIIWIKNIHQLDVNRSTQNIESDPTFLLGILLKHFQKNSLKIQAKNNIIMIGSTHLPKKVDPSLISPDRLDRILNIRLLNTYQRRNQFAILLNRNNLQLKKNLLCVNEFGSRTMGYNMRDLAALTNEISLISLTKNKSLVCNNITKLAFNRQVLGFSHTNSKPNYQHNLKILLYKIGKAIIQNIIIQGFVTNPLNISNFLWKKKFYYLSKWYLEPSIDDSIIKESTILVHVLGCLAGIAARDSWSLLEKDVSKSISLDKSIENDLDLAFSILEAFSSDFPWLETCENQLFDYRRKKPHIFLTKNFLNIMHKGIFAIANKSIQNTQNNSQDEYLLAGNKSINKIISEFNNTAWSPRFWRLNFSRSHLFNWIKRPNDFEFFHTFGFSKKKDFERRNNEDQLIGKRKEQLFYERILPRVRKRNVEELESQFENILLEEQFEILGFFNSATQYKTEYQLNTKPRLFIGKRVLWDPIGSFSQLRHFIFSSREFFVDEEMLRRLYITYGVRRERERSLSSHRIERFFIGRGYNKDLINKLSVRWWNQLPIDKKQNIYTLKRMEKIGIRLKRPQIFTPVYLYQRWLIENVPEKFSRLDLLTHRDRWIEINTIVLDDPFAYNIILESYQYLFEFFLSNKVLLDRITKILLKKKWIFQNEIVNIIYSNKKY